MEMNCYSYWGQDDDQKIIFVEQKTLAANDERVKKYQSEYKKVQAYAQANGYKVVDVATLTPEDYAYYLNLVKTLAGEEIEESNSMHR